MKFKTLGLILSCMLFAALRSAQGDPSSTPPDASWLRQRVADLKSFQGSLDFLDHPEACGLDGAKVDVTCLNQKISQLSGSLNALGIMSPKFNEETANFKAALLNCRIFYTVKESGGKNPDAFKSGIEDSCFRAELAKFQKTNEVQNAITSLKAKLPKKGTTASDLLESQKSAYRKATRELASLEDTRAQLEVTHAACSPPAASQDASATNKGVPNPADDSTRSQKNGTGRIAK